MAAMEVDEGEREYTPQILSALLHVAAPAIFFEPGIVKSTVLQESAPLFVEHNSREYVPSRILS